MLWPYLQALWVHWWALMSCAVFTLLGIFVLAFNKSNKWALWATFGAAIILLFVAAFLAWRDEHIQVLAYEKERPSLAFPSAEIKPIPDQQGNVAELRLNIGFMNDGQQTLVHTRGRLIVTDARLNSSPMINQQTSYANPVAPKERFTFTVPVAIGSDIPATFVICLINYESLNTGSQFHQEFYFIGGHSDAQGRFYNQFAGATLEQKALIVQYLGKL